jgi:hypothetical protein
MLKVQSSLSLGKLASYAPHPSLPVFRAGWLGKEKVGLHQSIQCCRAPLTRGQIVKALKENWEDALKKSHV